MTDGTKIEWTDATWNPLRGCSRVSEGCRNCYAETVAGRFSGPGQPYEGLVNKHGAWNGSIKIVPHLLDQPLRWKRPRRIFVNSMSDLFHDNVPTEFIDLVFVVMAYARHHTFQVLTKRPERMRAYLRDMSVDSDDYRRRWDVARTWLLDQPALKSQAARRSMGEREYVGMAMAYQRWPLPNVWLGVSVEDQATADARIPVLLATPAAVRWISAEPLLGPVDLRFLQPNDPPVEIDALAGTHGVLRPHGGQSEKLDWVVVGGESGAGARPMHPEWARSLRDQCANAGVPFYMKQAGVVLAREWGCSDRKGHDPAQWPEPFPREYPV